MQFRDRVDAGQRLAARLMKYAGEAAVIYALPRGGVTLGAIVAETLNKPLDLLIPRKVGHVNHPEYAVCAVTEDGHKFCNEEAIQSIDPKWLEEAIEKAQEEAKRRREAYLEGRKPVDVDGKTAIIVDDGVATGLTMLAAIAQVADKNPAKIVAAVPVAPQDTADLLKEHADELVAVELPEFYKGAVGSYYEDFRQVEDGEVKTLMEQFSS